MSPGGSAPDQPRTPTRPSAGPGRRGPKPSLSLEAIGQGALEIADAEGLEGVTVRRLAKDLGVGMMTLYGYVRTKDEILDQLTEIAFREVELPDAGRWDERLHELFVRVYELLVKHPSVAHLYSVRALVGDAELRISDFAIGHLRAGGLDLESAFSAQRTLTSYTVGAALFHVRTTMAGAEESRWASLRAHAMRDGFSNVLAVVEQFDTERDESRLRRTFLDGLSYVLAGIRRQIETGSQS